MAELPTPEVGDEGAWVTQHLGDLAPGDVTASPIRGGQSAANIALATFDVRGYASRRNEVWPPERRGASRLSPYIRHGMLTLPRVWDHVEGGPVKDVSSFRDELLWQEYARHAYARLGSSLRHSLRYEVPERGGSYEWPKGMRCIDESVSELRRTGWVTNQQRMWLASHWTVRDGAGWIDGEDDFFRHLLDGSRAANGIGWQWTVGALTGKPYGFSRWQVTKRAPALCATCPLADDCPIEQWPDERAPQPLADIDPRVRRAATPAPVLPPTGPGTPEGIWLTAESLGDDDPALAAHPDLPTHFVWDLPLLRRLRLAPVRLVFLAQCLADLATRRRVVVHAGDPREELRGIVLAATRAPVPGWESRAASLDLGAVLPWPWLVPPHGGPVTSFTAWRRRAGA